MTSEQIILVKSSWRRLVEDEASIAELFYARLFDQDPSLQNLFTGDIRAQQKKFVSTLSMVVANLDTPQVLLPKVRDLGLRHSGYGVKEEHYSTVERALLWALGRSLPEDFDAATEEAWRRAYRTLADAMIHADTDQMMHPR